MPLQDIRRQYRELFYTADIGASISGAIMFTETLGQSSSEGVPFVQCLQRQGVLPGIKVDQVRASDPPLLIASMGACRMHVMMRADFMRMHRA